MSENSKTRRSFLKSQTHKTVQKAWNYFEREKR